MEPVAAGYIIAVSVVVPLIQCPVFSRLVLILPTSEGWQAELTHLVLFNGMKGAQTQDPKILSWPPSPISQHQASPSDILWIIKKLQKCQTLKPRPGRNSELLAKATECSPQSRLASKWLCFAWRGGCYIGCGGVCDSASTFESTRGQLE